MTNIENRRILVIDDNPSIHEEFRRILERCEEIDSQVEEPDSVLGAATPDLTSRFEIDTALQGDEGLQKITSARREGRPYAVVFVDIRMPPGIDGVETIERAWTADPDIQFVLYTSNSDYTARDVLAHLGVSDRLLVLRKPCDALEILLLATSLAKKWNLAQPVQV